METSELKCEILSEECSQYDLSFKLIILGDAGVGKSSLTLKALKDYFVESYSATVGFEFYTQTLKIQDKYIKLQIWDTCGQEVYRSLISSFYRNSSLAMMVYAVNNFNHIDSWLKEVKTQSSPDIKIFLVGNKTDLETERKVTTEEAQQFVTNNEISYFVETSAKTGFNVKNAFMEAGKILYLEHLKYKDRASRPGSMGSLKNSGNIKLPQLPKDDKNNTNYETINPNKKGCC